MCGINGALNKPHDVSLENIVQRMNDAMAHRGPDAHGFFENEHVALGHRRLSIIDTSAAGNQPYFSEDRTIILVFNGEIYNYVELKKELSSSYHFISDTDTEVIIAAYRKWGIQCLKHLIGMFAFALVDTNEGVSYLVRDRLGIKPLYYSIKNNVVYFASEIRSLLASGEISRKLNTSALSDFLRYQTVHAPSTILDEVKMMMPGEMMVVKNNGTFRFERYWNASDFIGVEVKENAEEMRGRIYELLENAVAIQMRADVPFGAFLSGGIDSSIVVGLMSKVSSHAVKTFSVTFHEKEFDEGPYSSLIARRFDTDHTAIELSSTDFLKWIPSAIAAMDHPSGDGPNTFVVSKVTREAGVKMALSGLGGDEVFAGYDVFKRIYSLHQKKWMAAMPQVMKNMAASVLTRFKPGIASQKIAALLKEGEWDTRIAYALTRQVWMDEDVRSILCKDFNPVNEVLSLSESIHLQSDKILSGVSVAEMSTYMSNILLRDSDQMSMAHALELRVPFLDHRLVEYVLGVNDVLKYPHTPKQLLVESCGDLIPNEIVDRPKMGFTFPWKIWMKNELKSFCEEGLNELQKIHSIQFSEIQKRWDKFLNDDVSVPWSRIWPLVVLGHWIKTNEIND